MTTLGTALSQAQAQGLDRLDAQLLLLHVLGQDAHDRFKLTLHLRRHVGTLDLEILEIGGGIDQHFARAIVTIDIVALSRRVAQQSLDVGVRPERAFVLRKPGRSGFGFNRRRYVFDWRQVRHWCPGDSADRGAWHSSSRLC